MPACSKQYHLRNTTCVAFLETFSFQTKAAFNMNADVSMYIDRRVLLQVGCLYVHK